MQRKKWQVSDGIVYIQQCYAALGQEEYRIHAFKNIMGSLGRRERLKSNLTSKSGDKVNLCCTQAVRNGILLHHSPGSQGWLQWDCVSQKHLHERPCPSPYMPETSLTLARMTNQPFVSAQLHSLASEVPIYRQATLSLPWVGEEEPPVREEQVKGPAAMGSHGMALWDRVSISAGTLSSVPHAARTAPSLQLWATGFLHPILLSAERDPKGH